MGRRKVSTTVYFDPNQGEHLKVISERTKIPMAELVRASIDMLLYNREPTWLTAEFRKTISGITHY